MGVNYSQFCLNCIKGEDEPQSIPLIVTSSKSSFSSSTADLSSEIPEFRIENHPKQDFYLKQIELATIEFLSHIRGSFEEEGFSETLKKENIRVSSKETELGYILKSEIFIDFTPNEIIDLILDIKNRKTWDDNVEKIELVLTLPEDTTITYVKYKKLLVIASRDVVLLNKAMRAHNGLVFVSTSCEVDEYPVTDAAVRAQISLSGYYLEPVSPSKTKIVSYTIADVGGSIPKALVKTAAATALPRFIKNMERGLKKRRI